MNVRFQTSLFPAVLFFATVSLRGADEPSPPEVLSLEPARYSNTASGDVLIRATFDREMSATSFNDRTFLVFGNLTGAHSGTVSYDSASYTAMLDPDEDFLPGERVEAVLRENITSAEGEPLRDGFVWQFRIGSSGGTGQFEGATAYNVGDNPQSITACDINSDGFPDIVTANEDDGSLSVLFNRGDGTFDDEEKYPLGWLRPRSVISADMNSDGYIDLVVVSEKRSRVLVLSNNRAGWLETATIITVENTPRWASASDLEVDGYLDLAVSIRGTYELDPRGYLIIENKSNLSFEITKVHDLDQKAQSVATADWNTDGLIDVAVCSEEPDSQLVILLSEGGHDYLEHQRRSLSYRGASDPENADAGDLDGNGVPDIATANSDNHRVSVLLNGSGGLLRDDVLYRVGEQPLDVELCDIDGDGDLDIVATNNADQTLSVRLNRGDGEFERDVRFEVGRSAEGIAAVDFDGDDDLDVVVSNPSENTVSVFLNRNESLNLPPESPQPLLPIDAGFVDTDRPELIWTNPFDEDGDRLHFRVTISKDANFAGSTVRHNSRDRPLGFTPTPPVAQGESQVSLQVHAPDALSDTTYYWEVSAWDGHVHVGCASELSFTVDTQPPDIRSVALSNPDLQPNWINPLNTPVAKLEVAYSEKYADSVVVSSPDLGELARDGNILSGENSHVEVEVPISGLVDGNHTLRLALKDKAGNVDLDSLNIRLDGLPPLVIGVTLLDPAYEDNWYSQTLSPEVVAEISYSEAHPDSAVLYVQDLGLQAETSDVPGGTDTSIVLSLPMAGSPDGVYDLIAIVMDSLDNRGEATGVLRLDGTKPTGTVASSPQVSRASVFAVTFSGGSDGLGSGLSGRYDVRYRMDDGPWATWLSESLDTIALFEGAQGHVYSFEAGAWDNVGNCEAFLGVAETATLVDTMVVDVEAPGPPLDLAANGENPSPWFSGPVFAVSWVNPPDASDIARSLYKLGPPPTHKADTSGHGPAEAPLFVRVTEEDGQFLYLWLEDGQGNADYNRWSVVLLRLDSALPKIESVELPNEQYTGGWHNPLVDSVAQVSLKYSEMHPQRAELSASGFGDVLRQENLPGGVGAETMFSLDITGVNDGIYGFKIVLTDSAGNADSTSGSIGVDSTPPTGTRATSPEISPSIGFGVIWSSGDDGNGSGLSGSYDVWVQVDEGEWSIWLDDFQGSSADYIGEHGHTYGFEAMAKDNVGNSEHFAGQPESVTRVDTSFSDTTAPPSPSSLTADGASPSPWKAVPTFSLEWENPPDPSEIGRSLYKLGEPPNSSDDTTHSGPPGPPLVVETSMEDGEYVYLWLEDGRGNADYTTFSSVELLYDGTPPSIAELVLPEPAFAPNWYNPNLGPLLNLEVHYSERHAAQAIINSSVLDSAQTLLGIPSGDGEQVLLQVDISDVPDGRHELRAEIADSAGNTSADSVTIRLDGTPPSGTTASSPQVSTSPTFQVSWATKAGADSSGSGVSGLYNVRVRQDGVEWQDWLLDFQGTEAVYQGEHGSVYDFEVAVHDNVGNLEVLTGVPESTTLVDTSSTDVEAPAAPVSLIANGDNPSPWQSSPLFEISWENPLDPSGVVRCLYKFGSPPISRFDTSGAGPGSPPIEVVAEEEGDHSVFLWLQDGRGNADHTRYSTVRVRYDSTSPVIDSLALVGPGYGENWFSQLAREKVPVQVEFEEARPAYVEASSDLFQAVSIRQEIPNGDAQLVDLGIPVTGVADGSHTVRVTVVDSAGNRSDTAQVVLNLDGTPPTIEHFVPSAVSEDSSTTLSARVTDNMRVVAAWLFYKLGGARTYESLQMQGAQDSVVQATLPDSLLTSRGLDYYIEVSDGLNPSHHPSSSWAERPHTLTVRILGQGEGLIKESPQPFGGEENAYRLISLPILPDDPSPSAVLVDDLGIYDTKRWRFFQFDPAKDSYLEFPYTQDFFPGSACWLITSLQDIRLDAGVGTTVPTNEAVAIPLAPGWNDIGVPFDFSVDWADILTASGLSDEVIGPYTYAGRWLIPPEVKRLDPWEGCSVYVESEGLTLMIPPLESMHGVAKPTEPLFPQAKWQIGIEAYCGLSVDVANYIGVAEEASDGLDVLDFLEPPPIGRHVSLSFSHFDWLVSAGSYTSDFRPDFETGAVWQFEVSTNKPGAEVALLVQGVDDVPSEFDVTLVDEFARTQVDLRAIGSYSFDAPEEGPARTFKLVIGKQEFVKQEAGDISDEARQFRLYNSYPNPFNGITTTTYELATHSELEISIYNLLGQKIRRLISASQDAGFYSVQWDGRDESGEFVSSGVYLVRMEAGSYSSTRKVVFAR